MAWSEEEKETVILWSGVVQALLDYLQQQWTQVLAIVNKNPDYQYNLQAMERTANTLALFLRPKKIK